MDSVLAFLGLIAVGLIIWAIAQNGPDDDNETLDGIDQDWI